MRALLLVLLVACEPSPGEARDMLASRDATKRQQGATALQKAYAKNPASLGDHGEPYWAERLAKVKGRSASDAMKILECGPPSGGEAGGGGATEQYRLDDFWTVTMFRSTRGDNTIFGHDPPRRNVIHVDVQPPEKLTGTWKTYYVNGAVFEALQLEKGVRQRDQVFHDNGRLRYEESYVDGMLDGAVVYRDAKGALEWEKTYAKGKQIGLDKMYDPPGKLRQEAHYADDKLDGLLRNFSEKGDVTFCAAYRAGVQLDGGCD